jgi:hypothetical protein
METFVHAERSLQVLCSIWALVRVGLAAREHAQRHAPAIPGR